MLLSVSFVSFKGSGGGAFTEGTGRTQIKVSEPRTEMFFHPRQAALKESRDLSLFMPRREALPWPPNELKSNEVNEKGFTASARGPV